MADQRPRCAGPVQNSEVYVLRQVPPFSTIPPLSPPSPITPAEDDDFGAPIEALRLPPKPAAIAAACGKKLAAESRLARAVHVLSTEAAALHHITQLYSADRAARDSFDRAVEAIVRRQPPGGGQGKLVVIGVGKSGHIAKKLVATFNSVAVQAVFLHPTEALHGDLGLINRQHDTLLLITFSGKTPELLALLPHLDPSLPMIILTAHTPTPPTFSPSSTTTPSSSSSSSSSSPPDQQRQKCESKCELLLHRPQNTVILPALIHEPETVSFGVAAPTTSTTVALAVGDALALVVARELYPGEGQEVKGKGGVAEVFKRNHPGGAIGEVLRGGGSGCIRGRKTGLGQEDEVRERRDGSVEEGRRKEERDVRSVMVRIEEIPELRGESETGSPTGADALRAGYASPSGWVRLPPQTPSTPRPLPHPRQSHPYPLHPSSRPPFQPFHHHPSHNTPTIPSLRVIAPSRLLALRTADLALPIFPNLSWLMTPPDKFVSIAAETSVARAAEWIRGLRAATSSLGEDGGQGGNPGGLYWDEAVVTVMEKGECIGFVEVGRLLKEGLEEEKEAERASRGVVVGR